MTVQAHDITYRWLLFACCANCFLDSNHVVWDFLYLSYIEPILSKKPTKWRFTWGILGREGIFALHVFSIQFCFCFPCLWSWHLRHSNSKEARTFKEENLLPSPADFGALTSKCYAIQLKDKYTDGDLKNENYLKNGNKWTAKFFGNVFALNKR